MQVFLCVSTTGKVNGKDWVYIEAERWFDARSVSYTLFGTDQVKFEAIAKRPEEWQHQGNFYTVKWVGSPMDPRRQPQLEVTKCPETPSSSSESSSSSGEEFSSTHKLQESLLGAETPSTMSPSETSSDATTTKTSRSNVGKTRKASSLAAPAKRRKTASRGGD